MFDLGAYQKLILQGLLMTLGLGLLSFGAALVFGFCGALAKNSSSALGRALGHGYSYMVRGLPELLLILLIFYGLPDVINQGLKYFHPSWRVEFPPFLTGFITLGFIYGGFCTDALYEGLGNVSRGELEAGQSFGLNKVQVFSLIHIPLMWRFALPSLSNIWQSLIKATSLVSVIGLMDLARATDTVARSTRQSFYYFLLAAGLYLLITLISGLIFQAWIRYHRRGQV